jgi:hypothetical protein
MRDYAEVMLELNRAIKKVHEFCLKNQATEAYLLSCDVVDYAQELEDTLQKDANIQ